MSFIANVFVQSRIQSGTMHCIFHCQSLVPSYLEQFLRLFVFLNLDIFESRGQLFGKMQNNSWHLGKGLRAESLMTVSGDVEAVSWSITLWETLAQTLGQVRLVQHTAPSMVCPWPPVFSAVALTRSGGDALSLSVTHISTPFPPSLDLHTVPSAWNLALFYYLSHDLYCSMTQTHGHIPLSKVLKLSGFVSLNLDHRSLLDGWLMKTWLCNAKNTVRYQTYSFISDTASTTKPQFVGPCFLHLVKWHWSKRILRYFPPLKIP